MDRLRGTAAQHDEVGEKLKTLRGRATGQKVKTSGFSGRYDRNGIVAKPRWAIFDSELFGLSFDAYPAAAPVFWPVG